MAGRWRLQDDGVWFDQPADTYVRFTPWKVAGDRLSSEIRNGPYTIVTVLRRR